MTQIPQSKAFIFFGTSDFSVHILTHLAKHGYVPKAIITTPDSPQGRALKLTPTETKSYGLTHNIPVYTYAKLDTVAIAEIQQLSQDISYFLVASYGLIIPQAVLDIPPCGVLNIHPSLLPNYRGATPIQSAILDDISETGTTIMLVDALMDHGPIYAQQKRKNPSVWPISYLALESELAELSVELFVKSIEAICSGDLLSTPQVHEQATYTKKIQKAQGEIDLEHCTGSEGYMYYLRYLAFEVWPGTFFFVQKKDSRIRVKIKKAHFDYELSRFCIDTVVPEGQKEVSYTEFMKRIFEYYS